MLNKEMQGPRQARSAGVPRDELQPVVHLQVPKATQLQLIDSSAHTGDVHQLLEAYIGMRLRPAIYDQGNMPSS